MVKTASTRGTTGRRRVSNSNKPRKAASKRPAQRRRPAAKSRPKPTGRPLSTRPSASTRAATRPAAQSRARKAIAAAQRPARKKRDPRIPSLLTRVRERIKFGVGRQADDVWGLVLVVVGVLILLGFFDNAGPVGRWVVSSIQFLVGVWAYALPAVFVGLGGALVIGRHRDDYGRLAFGSFLAFIGSLALFHLLTGSVALAQSIDLVMERGGALGSLIAFPMRRMIGFSGAFVVISAVMAVGIMVLTRTTIREVTRAAWEVGSSVRRFLMARLAARRASRVDSRPPIVEERPTRLVDVATPPEPRAPRARKAQAPKPQAEPPAAVPKHCLGW